MPESIENLLAKRFIARTDVKAIQQANGAYHPDRTKWTRDDLTAHVAGIQTFGHYQLSPEGMCKFMCFDIDWLKPKPDADPPVIFHYEDQVGISREFNPREAWLDPQHPHRQDMIIKMRCLSEYLAMKISRDLAIGVAIVQSGGKGLHVYGFMDEPTPAAIVREAAHDVLRDNGHFEAVKGENFWRPSGEGYVGIEIEVFPKQDSLDGKDLGNLLRLPLGVNRKTGKKSFFVDVNRGYNELYPADPVEALETLNPWGATVQIADNEMTTIIDGSAPQPLMA